MTSVCVCVCLSMCLSVRISPELRARYLSIFCACCLWRSSILLCLRCDTLCASSFVDDIMFFSTMSHTAVWIWYEEPISLKFTSLGYCKLGQNSICIILTNYFEITYKLKYKKNGEIWRKNYQNARHCSCCYYGDGLRWRRNKYASDFDAWT